MRIDSSPSIRSSNKPHSFADAVRKMGYAITAAAAMLLHAEQTDAQPPQNLPVPPAPKAPVTETPALPDSAPNKKLHKPSTVPLQITHPLLERPVFQQIRAFHAILTRDIQHMDDDDFFIRKQHTLHAIQAVVLIKQQIHPLPRAMFQQLDLDTRDTSLEVWYRTQHVLEYAQQKERQPTRVPIEKYCHTEDVLNMLAKHSSKTFRFRNPADKEKLRTLQLHPDHNTYAEIVRAICLHTGTKPTLPTDAQHVIEFGRCDTPVAILIDKSGLLLGVYSPESAELDVYADPQIAMIELVHVSRMRQTPNTFVNIHPDINPLWHSLDGFGQPTVGKQSQINEYKEVKSGEVGVQLAILEKPKTITAPLHTAPNAGIAFGSQMLHTEHTEGSNSVRFLMFSDDGAKAIYWTESLAITPYFSLEDAKGTPIQTTVTGLKASDSDNENFSVTLTGDREPARVHMRGYTEKGRYIQRKSQSPIFYFTLPDTSTTTQ